MKYSTLYSVLLVLLAGGGWLVAGVARAGTATVTNDISVSAESGGVSGGTVKQGEARVRVAVEQAVNGEELEPIQIDEVSGDGAVRVDVHTQVGGSADESYREINVNVGSGGVNEVSVPVVPEAGGGSVMELEERSAGGGGLEEVKPTTPAEGDKSSPSEIATAGSRKSVVSLGKVAREVGRFLASFFKRMVHIFS